MNLRKWFSCFYILSRIFFLSALLTSVAGCYWNWNSWGRPRANNQEPCPCPCPNCRVGCNKFKHMTSPRQKQKQEQSQVDRCRLPRVSPRNPVAPVLWRLQPRFNVNFDSSSAAALISRATYSPSSVCFCSRVLFYGHVNFGLGF